MWTLLDIHFVYIRDFRRGTGVNPIQFQFNGDKFSFRPMSKPPQANQRNVLKADNDNTDSNMLLDGIFINSRICL